MKRRAFIAGLGIWLAGCPLDARAQQLPKIGYLGTASLASDAARLTAFRRGLGDVGQVEGKNVAIEFRWANGDYARLRQYAVELVGLPIAAMFAATLPAALSAKDTTSKVPIVFANGNDPVKFGLVASMNKPGGNITGISFLINVLAAKQLELLHEIVAEPAAIGYFVNPNNPNAATDTKEVQNAAGVLGRKLVVVNVGAVHEIDAGFATAVQQRVGALIFHADSLLTSQHEHLAKLAERNAMPAIFHLREFADVGGLMSYGASVGDAYRQAGLYMGRILNGEKPHDLPVQQSTKIELVINLKTARALRLTVPPALLARADEVIE